MRKPNFKLRKTLFQIGFERNGKIQKVLELHIEKGGEIFWRIFCLFIKDYPFKKGLH